MPDWNNLIRERLGSLKLPPAVRNEVIEELAAHLEDVYEGYIAAGIGPSEATRLALSEVDSRRPLAREIERSKQESVMNDRTKQLWIPALISLGASMIWLMVIAIIADKLHLEWKYANVAFLPYAIWIISLPLIGAVTGRLSYRAGSSRSVRFMAVAFPSLVMLVLWLGIVVSLLARKTPQTIHAMGLGIGLLAWVVVPGIALLLGTLPLFKHTKINA